VPALRNTRLDIAEGLATARQHRLGGLPELVGL
jgi:hypothetical protein